MHTWILPTSDVRAKTAKIKPVATTQTLRPHGFRSAHNKRIFMLVISKTLAETSSDENHFRFLSKTQPSAAFLFFLSLFFFLFFFLVLLLFVLFFFASRSCWNLVRPCLCVGAVCRSMTLLEEVWESCSSLPPPSCDHSTSLWSSLCIMGPGRQILARQIGRLSPRCEI